jgi:hypothetical protein
MKSDEYLMLMLADTGASSYNLFSIVAIVVGIAGLFGIAFAVFRSNLATQTIALLKENNEALSVRVTQIEASSKVKDDLISHQGEQITVLRDLVTGTSIIEKLAVKMAENHDEVLVHFQRLEKV